MFDARNFGVYDSQDSQRVKRPAGAMVGHAAHVYPVLDSKLAIPVYQPL
jgi:hypothetical protein